MSTLAHNFFNLDVLGLVLPQLANGALVTLYLSLLVVPGGIAVGIVIASIHSIGLRWINWLLIAYVDFFRALPPLVLLIFVYYALSHAGLELGTIQAVMLALILNTSAFFGEVIRAGIEAIPRGQIEASRSTGLTYLQTLRHVILPQAIRNMTPDLISNTLETIKLTSLASVVTLPELLRMARIAQGNTLNATPLIAAALIYLACLWPLVRLLSRYERRMLTSH